MTTMTKDQILISLSKGEITWNAASKLLAELDKTTKPKIGKDGKLFVMPGSTFTVYQLVRTIEVAKELLAMAAEHMNAASRQTAGEGRPDKDGVKDEFTRYFKGDVLVAYKPEHVAYCEAFFAKQASKSQAKAA